MVARVCLFFIFSNIAVHLPPLLVAAGYTLGQAAALGAVIGPAKVTARMIELLGGGRHLALVTMVASTRFMVAGLFALSLHAPTALCLAVYGMGLGLWTIARGTVPLALFGAAPNATTMARVALPVLTVSALAPMAGLVLLPAFGPVGTLRALGLVACVPCLLAVLLWAGRIR